MSFREHLWHLLPHAEWWGMEWFYHHYRGVLGPIMLTVLIAIVQKVQGISYDWWVLGVLFLGSLGLVVYSHRRDRRQEIATPPLVANIQPTIAVSPTVEALRNVPEQNDYQENLEQKNHFQQFIKRDLHRTCREADIVMTAIVVTLKFKGGVYADFSRCLEEVMNALVYRRGRLEGI
jgi:hypothetical protein